ncbi:hypothetical protein LWI28_009750 [Acer negundo]|uniref:Uncharacterized protein n=1 Tax=Acer negundo TaxID=4023 RepID=A0AAD5IGQ1_ACENE|nr:hypothetical protein LWI28_009750 [Acer negundo]
MDKDQSRNFQSPFAAKGDTRSPRFLKDPKKNDLEKPHANLNSTSGKPLKKIVAVNCYNEAALRTIETVHMVKEIPPFQVKREMNEKSNKEKKTFIDEICNEKKADTFEVNDFSKVPEPD